MPTELLSKPMMSNDVYLLPRDEGQRKPKGGKQKEERMEEGPRCLDCGDSYRQSSTKRSPRCPDCRERVHNLRRVHLYKIGKLEREIDQSLPFADSHHDGTENRYQLPYLSESQAESLERQDRWTEHLNQIMSPKHSYGSEWRESEAGFAFLTEDNKGMGRSPGRPNGTTDGISTTNPELAVVLEAKAAEARNHPWFQENPWWRDQTYQEIQTELQTEQAELKQRGNQARNRPLIPNRWDD